MGDIRPSVGNLLQFYSFDLIAPCSHQFASQCFIEAARRIFCQNSDQHRCQFQSEKTLDHLEKEAVPRSLTLVGIQDINRE